MRLTSPVKPTTSKVSKPTQKAKNAPVKGSKVQPVKPTPPIQEEGYNMLTPSSFPLKSGRLARDLTKPESEALGKAIIGAGLIHRMACKATGIKFESTYSPADAQKAFLSLTSSRVLDAMNAYDKHKKALWAAREAGGNPVALETQEKHHADMKGAKPLAGSIGAHMATVLNTVGAMGDAFYHTLPGQEGKTRFDRVRIVQRWAGVNITERRGAKGEFSGE